MFHEYTKHIEVNGHLVWERILSNNIKLSIPTNEQLDDTFTKPLDCHQSQYPLGKLGVLIFALQLEGEYYTVGWFVLCLVFSFIILIV